MFSQEGLDAQELKQVMQMQALAPNPQLPDRRPLPPRRAASPGWRAPGEGEEPGSETRLNRRQLLGRFLRTTCVSLRTGN